MSKGEFEKRSHTQAEITKEECNHSCRIAPPYDFPEPNRQQKWLKLSDIEETRKEFYELLEGDPLDWIYHTGEKKQTYEKLLLKWFGGECK